MRYLLFILTLLFCVPQALCDEGPAFPVIEEDVDIICITKTPYSVQVLFYRTRQDGGNPLLATRWWDDGEDGMVLQYGPGGYTLSWRDYWSCHRIVHAKYLMQDYAEDTWWIDTGPWWKNALQDLKQP